jgi:predicted nucleotidyltransferase component of viral defense system
MNGQSYKNQVKLLLRILPYVSLEECFALHGGTAINLFVHNMPRLSVDVDLTYLPIESRQTTLQNIDTALSRIKNRIENALPNAQTFYKSDVGKLFIRANNAEVKLEVNLVSRGAIKPPSKMLLCYAAQEKYDASSVMQVVPISQLYGGKICAALDRQHPRDLFDVKYLMEDQGFFNKVREGFLLCLLSSDRPIHEVLEPNFQDQRQALENQFVGMSEEVFTYKDYEETREKLVQVISSSLTEDDKRFILSVKNCEPDWSIYDFERFPSIQWKLQNLKKLKENSPTKHQELFEALKNKLF